MAALASSVGAAQEPARPAPTGDNAQELAKQAQNPIANLISVPFQNNTDSTSDRASGP